MPANAATTTDTPTIKTAYFAGGCFWCMEAAFDFYGGVESAISGYMGGSEETASYTHVGSGTTDHVEVVQVTYHPTEISYEKLLEIYWENIDPTDAGGQFADRGSQYITAIYVANEEERHAAEATKAAEEKRLNVPIATQILPTKPFYKAEEYHQDYHQKNPQQYERYKYGSGRVTRLKELHGEKEKEKE